jgi:signal transduction histidine kinase
MTGAVSEGKKDLKYLLLILGLHAFTILTVVQSDAEASKLVDWRTQEVVLCLLSGFVSFALWNRKTQGLHQMLLVIQLLFWFILEYVESNLLFGALAASVLTIEALVFLGFSGWLLKALQFALLLPLVVHPIAVWGKAPQTLQWVDLLVLMVSMLALEFAIHKARTNSENLRELQAINEVQNNSIANLLTVNLDYQNYAEKIEENSTISERKRLTREIHDIVGYSLINLRMMLEASLDLSSQENKALRELLLKAKDQVQSALKDARQTLRNLRDIETERLGCVQRTQKLVQSFSAVTGIRVEVNYGNLPWSLGEDIDTTLFRILQESMTNSFCHGKADLIQIGFSISQGKLFLNVGDNGQGSKPIKVGIGLSGMEERLEKLHGTLQANSYDYGFMLHIEIPVELG